MMDMETAVLKSNQRIWEVMDSESTDNEGLLYFPYLHVECSCTISNYSEHYER
jgi:hypothetical protein